MQISVLALPKLKVSADSYCSQEVADAAIKWLQANKADLIESLAEYEKTSRDHPHYLRDANLIIHSLLTEAANEVFVPPTRLARLDLVHELGRRIRAFYKIPDFKMQGSAASEVDFLVVSTAIPETKLKHLQDPAMVQKILNYIYQSHLHLAVEFLEEKRREIYTAEIANEFERVLKEVVPRETGIPVNEHLAHQVFIGLGGQLTELLKSKTN